MEAQELRIGNWILNGIGEEFQVNRETIYNFNVGQSLLGAFKPIPITEEWLIKFGFEGFKDKYYNSFDKDDITINIECGEFNFYYDTICVEFKYIHQLQNLFYALKGKELSCTNA